MRLSVPILVAIAVSTLLAGQSAPEDQKYAVGACVARNDDRAIGVYAAE